MRACLYSGSPFTRFSHHRSRYFVLPVLDFGEFKLFDDSIQRNLRELSLFILYVGGHDFESPWLSGC